MNREVASTSQLRMVYVRWALFLIPLLILLAMGVSRYAGSGDENLWYRALQKPDIMPEPWVFIVAWTSLYTLMGLALAMIVCARGAPLRFVAILLFVLQYVLGLFWSVYFFAMHQVSGGFFLLLLILVLVAGMTIIFSRIRALAAWMMLPYLAWLCFAATLNYQMDQLNPDAETLIIPRGSTKIKI